VTPVLSAWLGLAAPAAAPMHPSRYAVVSRRAENHDTVTLLLRPVDHPIQAPLPGQFTMLYAFGVGEVPVSASGVDAGVDSRDQVLAQTIRAVGAVTRALCEAAPGDMIGVRGSAGAARRRGHRHPGFAGAEHAVRRRAVRPLPARPVPAVP
jgi:NAD(P)H-flavin reductase